MFYDNEISQGIMQKKYLQDNETPEQFIERVVSIFSDDLRDDARRIIGNADFLPAGRTLAGAGLKGKRKMTLSNCYIMPTPEDNLESIVDCAKLMARIGSYGGGAGVAIDRLRPKGSAVNNSAKESTGAVSFLRLFDEIGGLIGQNGRKMALMVGLRCDHPDIYEFLRIKENNEKLASMNISIKFTDEFMEAVKNKRKFKLHFESEYETIDKDIDAAEFFKDFCKVNWDYGDPGCIFIDRVRNHQLLNGYEDYPIDISNPCVTADTLILTDTGYKKIVDLVGKKVKIWNGMEWSVVSPKITGYNQKMLRITVSNGMTLDCTRYHKFIMSDGNRVKAENLHVGDKLAKWNYPIINGHIEDNGHDAYTNGFYSGDGTRGHSEIVLYGEKNKVIDRLNVDHLVHRDDSTKVVLAEIPLGKDYVPTNEMSVEYRLNWLAGLIDSDGTLNDPSGSISISSVNKKFLQDVQLMLTTLGCHSTVGLMHAEGDRELPLNDGSGDKGIHHCRDSYRLVISGWYTQMLLMQGMELSRVHIESTPNRNASRFITVTSIEEILDADVVYCFNEPINHSGIFNGIMTAQCAEYFGTGGNSCLTSDTLVRTVDGVKKLGSLEGKSGLVYATNHKFEQYANVVSKGIKEVFEVTLSNGSKIKATGDHKFLTSNGWKKLEDLSNGDNVSYVNQVNVLPVCQYDEEYEMYGWIHGGGWYNTTLGISFNYGDGDADIKERLLPVFKKVFKAEGRAPLKDDEVSYQLQTELKDAFAHCEKLGFVPGRACARELPTTFYDWTLEQQVSFIRGLMSADGFITGSTNSQIVFCSTSKTLIEQVQTFLAALGIQGRVSTTTFKAELNRKPQHRLVISKQAAKDYFNIIGFSGEKKSNKYQLGKNYKNDDYYSVVSIEPCGTEEVFDIMEVNHTNAFFANGFAVHNCNLGSINLYNMIDNKFTDDAEVNWEQLVYTTSKAVDMLDEILDYGYDMQPLDLNREIIKDWRSIGLGVFGLADALVAMGIRYGSPESRSFVSDVMECILHAALEESANRARDKGVFSKYDWEKTKKSSFIRMFKGDQLYDKVRSLGLRNGSLLSIAPTGTISLFAGKFTGGVEPMYQVAYERTSHSTEDAGKKFFVYARGVEDLLRHHGLEGLSVDEIKKRFPFVIESHEVPYKERVLLQSIMQDYVDNAISSTVNLPNSATWQDIYDIYTMAWEQGLKGITVFRDGCKRGNILGVTEKKDIPVYNTIEPVKRRDKYRVDGATFKQRSSCVPSMYVTVNKEGNNIFEVFTNASGGCQANINTITRLVSLALRSGVKVKTIIEELRANKCPACQALRRQGQTLSLSCGNAIADAMEAMLDDTIDEQIEHDSYLVCPECGKKTLRPEGKCFTCSNCGFSKCD